MYTKPTPRSTRHALVALELASEQPRDLRRAESLRRLYHLAPLGNELLHRYICMLRIGDQPNGLHDIGVPSRAMPFHAELRERAGGADPSHHFFAK